MSVSSVKTALPYSVFDILSKSHKAIIASYEVGFTVAAVLTLDLLRNN